MTRIGGLASGMDIDSIVKDLMRAERMPLDKLKQKKQVLEWQRDDYRAMNTRLLDFRTELTQMKLTTKYRVRSVTSSDEAKVTATASTSASLASYSISKVDKLAEAENWVTNKIGIDAAKSLESQFGATPADFTWSTGTVRNTSLAGEGDTTLSLGVKAGTVKEADAAKMTVKVNGVSYGVIKSTDDWDTDPDTKQVKIDADGNLTFQENVASGATVQVDYILDSTDKYADFSFTTHTSKGTVTEKFLVQSTETLNQLVSKVNNSNAGLSMFYDEVEQKMSLTQKETGDHNTGTGGNISVSGGLASKGLKLDASTATITNGSDASFIINGLATTRKTNIFDMNGVSITLKQAFTTGAAVNLSINNDSNAVFDNIKSFIEKYNTLIDKISSKMSEEKYRSYTPLTDEQREQLSDKQQEQWEEKAKSGLLRRDSILTGVLSSMRSNFSQPVSNSETNALYNQLAAIGITTTSNYMEGGKLEINEVKLKAAINNNPEAVEALFRGGSDDSPISAQGIARRLYDSINTTMDKLNERGGNSFSTNQQFFLGRQLTNIDSSINRFEDRLIQVEDRYWKQFTAMEKAIQNANSQSMYLSQQFSNVYSR
ncbi:hypothetical protein BTO30_00955 [Domibacillus antri]|uniref:Flagellar hook-associated protein 2 n=1 Tax=Domibacillus antri TaxID=1714264 RepID=A0A1Q8QA59_9BACI|nr:hypothetical protein BTO30_00955 [Domibacillus antri]